jgi:hypothetical protein
LRTGAGISAKKRTTADGILGRRGRQRGRSHTGCLRIVADAEYVGETLAIESPNQLNGYVHIPICSSRNDGRGQIVALHHAQRVTAPAESDANIGLLREAHFIRVNPNAQNYVSRAIAPSTDAECGRVGSEAGRRVTSAYGIGRSSGQSHTRGAVREDERAGGPGCVSNARSLRAGLAHEREQGKFVHQHSVRF